MPELLALYPALAALAPATLGAPLEVPAGAVLFTQQQPCLGFPLLLEGEVRVSKRSAEGRTLELYRVGPGDLCLVSSACLFHGTPLLAEAVTTRPTRLLLIPPDTFHAWLDQRGFREMVLGAFAERMADLAALVDAIAFQRLDERLAAALLGRGPALAVTHQALAQELGTVREIVTRMLRRFEREGWVGLSREQIRILDSAALRRHARRSAAEAPR
jgi:CRP/FNR family transcriptional regulator